MKETKQPMDIAINEMAPTLNNLSEKLLLKKTVVFWNLKNLLKLVFHK